MRAWLTPVYLKSQYYCMARSIYTTRHSLPGILGWVQSWENQSDGGWDDVCRDSFPHAHLQLLDLESDDV